MTRTAWRVVWLLLALFVILFMMVTVTGHLGDTSLSPVRWALGLFLLVGWWAVLIFGTWYVWRHRGGHDSVHR